MSERFGDALACAMAIVPAVYSRNKMFSFFTHDTVKRARARSRAMRSLARELAGRLGRPAEVELTEDERGFVLRYKIPSVRMWRMAELTHLELACVIHLARVMKVDLPFARGDERERIERALTELPEGLRPGLTT